MRNQPFSPWSAGDDEQSSATDSRRRARRLAAAMWGALLVIGLRVAHVQVGIAERYVTPWLGSTQTEELIPARNGRIVTRDGVVLAVDETLYDLAIDYRWLESPSDEGWLRQQVARELTRAERRDTQKVRAVLDGVAARRERLLDELARVTDLPRDQLRGRLAQIQSRVESIVQQVEQRRSDRRREQASHSFEWSDGWGAFGRLVLEELTSPPERSQLDPIVIVEELSDHVVVADVPLRVAAEVQSRPAIFPGVHVRAHPQRTYPRGSLAAGVVGLRRPVPPGQTEEAVREQAESGAELTYDSQLQGRPGRRLVVSNRRGEKISEVVAEPPRDGRDVTLTLDSQLQQSAESLLDSLANDSRGAALIAMNLHTGDILALAATPRPDLSVLQRPTVEQWTALLNDPRQPLFQRELQLALPPGQVFKIVTALAALEAGVLDPAETIGCFAREVAGQRPACPLVAQSGVGHGDLNLPLALREDCPVFFQTLAQRLPAGELLRQAEQLGFGSRTGIDLPRENSGHVPELNASSMERDTRQLAIGQGALLVTPLQLLRAIAAIGNGGTLVTPHVADVARDSGPAAEGLAPQRHTAAVLDARSLLVLQYALRFPEQSQESPAGGFGAFPVGVAGMTGTAQAAAGGHHGWFVGYAPADNPRVAFVVALQDADDAARQARFVAREFLVEMLGLGLLQPSAMELSQSDLADTIPSPAGTR